MVQIPGAIISEDEWYKAAYYSGSGNLYWDYPTGTDERPDNHIIDPDPGNNANFFDDGWPSLGDPYWRTNRGEFENSYSAYRTFDQGGNVEEWNEAVFDLAGNYHRGVRGGGCLSSWSYLSAACDHKEGYGQTAEYAYLGFRVARVPEPSVVFLVVMGTVFITFSCRR